MWKLLVSFYVLYFLEKTRPQNGGSCQPGRWDAASLGCYPESHPTKNFSIYHVPSLFHRAHWTYNSMCLPGNIGFVIKKWSLETPINQMSSHSMHRTMPGTGLQEGENGWGRRREEAEATSVFKEFTIYVVQARLRTESPAEKCSCCHNQLENNSLFSKWCWGNRWRKIKLDPHLSLHIKVNSSWVKDLK